MKFVKDGEIFSISNYKMLLGIRGDSRRLETLERFQDVLSMDITYKGKPVDALCVDLLGNNPIVQLILPEKKAFDKSSNEYRTSDIRNFLSSTEFRGCFEKKFLEHVIPTEVHTEDYTTEDMFYLLSHEEVEIEGPKYFGTNMHTRKLDGFNETKYSRVRFINKSAYNWWLRTAVWKYTVYAGCVGYHGYVGYDNVNFDNLSCFPVCSIG